MSTKKFAGMEALQAFLDGCKTIFANITHKHTMSDISDYTIDSQLDSASVNPVQNAVITAELDTIIESKADWNQNDETAIDYVKNRTHWVEQATIVLMDTCTVVEDFNNNGMVENNLPNMYGVGLNNGSFSFLDTTAIVTFDGVQYRCPVWAMYGELRIGNAGLSGLTDDELQDEEYAKYVSDVPFCISQFNLSDEFEEQWEWYVSYRLSEIGATHTIKIEIENPDQTTYHHLDEKFIPDTIARTSYVEENFALKSEIGNVDLTDYYTKSEIDNLELITVDEIDAICGGAIQYAEDVMF